MKINSKEVKEEAIRKRGSRKKFLETIKKHKKENIDNLFNEKHDEVFNSLDCLQCANCCKTVGPLFTSKDIKIISKKLKMNSGEFTEKYLRVDEDQDYVLKHTPCPFLFSDNHCSIYSYRPKACREYPHTQMKNQKKLLSLNLKNCEYCPGVNEIFNRICKC